MSEENFKVSIDRNNCISCGNCWSVCNQVFEQNKKDLHSQITKKYAIKNDISQGLVPKNIKCVKDAQNSCPVNVIKVSEN